MFRNNFKTVDIDTTRIIDKVGMMTHRKSDDGEVQITALKFTDKDGGSILDLSFNKGPQEAVLGLKMISWTS